MGHYNTAVGTEKVRGRGAASNPANRFEKTSYQRSEWDEPEDPSAQTIFLRDEARSIVNYNDSPDVGFSASINPYRGCEHGCIYCYARPNHEYLGFSAGLDFETKILVKEDAPELLRRELASPRWEPQVIAISGVTDAYQPIERRLQLTRRCLEVLVEFRNPVVIITKSELVTRDIDLLSQLVRFDGILVFLSVTSLDSELARELEPRASQPGRRLAAIESLARALRKRAQSLPDTCRCGCPMVLRRFSKSGWRCTVHCRKKRFSIAFEIFEAAA